MIDRNTFLETLREVAAIASASDGPLSAEEIHRYFADMELSEEQEKLVYEYLKLPPEAREVQTGEAASDADTEKAKQEDFQTLDAAWPVGTTGACGTKQNVSVKTQEQDIAEEISGGKVKNGDGEKGEASVGSVTPEKISSSHYYQMYLEEVRARSKEDKVQLNALYEKAAAGDDSVTGEIVDAWLMRIIRMAGEYADVPVNAEDLIQEGNMALWMALGALPQMPADRLDAYLTERVTEGFASYIREVTGEADQTQAMLGKAALLHEAREFLAKENGQDPSIRQLAEYTHLSAEEIRDILALQPQDAKE